VNIDEVCEWVNTHPKEVREGIKELVKLIDFSKPPSSKFFGITREQHDAWYTPVVLKMEKNGL
jgi:hypothetical protein